MSICMLAKNYEEHKKKVKFPVFVQPKLNGLRALWREGGLFSRNMLQFHVVPEIVAQLRTLGNVRLDGELYSPTIPFQTFNGLMRKQTVDSLKVRNVQYYVFDIQNDLKFHQRLGFLKALLHQTYLPNVQLLTTDMVKTHREIQEKFREYCEAGFEGIMVRAADGFYVNKRTDVLLKWKPVEEEEFSFVGFAGTTSRNYRTFGAMVLRTKEGREFQCSGLSDVERQEVWDTVQEAEDHTKLRVTVRFNAKSLQGVPIHPRFMTFRWDLQEENDNAKAE